MIAKEVKEFEEGTKIRILHSKCLVSCYLRNLITCTVLPENFHPVSPPS